MKKTFNAKRNVGTKENPKWEYMGTVFIRENGTGGVLFLRTAQKDGEGKPIDEEIPLFIKRAQGAASKPAAGTAA